MQVKKDNFKQTAKLTSLRNVCAARVAPRCCRYS